MYSPFKNQNSVSSVFTMKCPVCGLNCLMFVMSSVCYVQGVLCLGFVCLGLVMSMVCYVQCISCPGFLCLGFVVSRVCYVQGLLCLVFVKSRVCLSRVGYVQGLVCLVYIMSRVFMSRVCRVQGLLCLGSVMYSVCYVMPLEVKKWYFEKRYRNVSYTKRKIRSSTTFFVQSCLVFVYLGQVMVQSIQWFLNH